MQQQYQGQLLESQKDRDSQFAATLANIKNEYERRIRSLQDRVQELTDTKHHLNRRVADSSTQQQLCQRCKAYLHLEQGLDAKIAQLSSYL